MRITRSIAFVLVGGAAACAASPSTASLTFDVCGPITVAPAAATADQLASLDDAIAMWHAQGVTGLARVDAGAQITLAFSDAAPALHGFYDDTSATVYVNSDVSDPAERAIVIAHELGHAFALVHIAATERASVMNPGNLTIAPDPGDHAALDAIWGACP